jgi:hypothetical protein
MEQTHPMDGDDLDTFLRDHGGLDGLARELGQDDPKRQRWGAPANENAQPRVGPLRRLVENLRRYCG